MRRFVEPGKGHAGLFALAFFERPWFDGQLRGMEAAAVGKLLLSVYRSYEGGRLLSKKEAGVAIGAEHPATVRKYINIAVDFGALTIQTSTLDRRLELLVPTNSGLEMIEREIKRLADEIEWGKALLDGDEKKSRSLWPTFFPMSGDGNAFLRSDMLAAANPYVIENPTKRTEAYISIFSETLKFCPENELARFIRALHLGIFLGKKKEALADLDVLLRMRPQEQMYRDLRDQIEQRTEKNDGDLSP